MTELAPFTAAHVVYIESLCLQGRTPDRQMLLQLLADMIASERATLAVVPLNSRSPQQHG